MERLKRQLLLVGLNHRTAPLELREQFSMSQSSAENVLDVLGRCWCDDPEYSAYEDCSKPSCKTCDQRICYEESCILSTCNRTELYALGSKVEALGKMLAAYGGVNPSQLKPHLYQHMGSAVTKHLFSVSAGLDSQVLGETQIIGQVRQAYEVALNCGSAGPVFSELFRRAIRAGKRVRTETALGRYSASLASVAMKLIGKQWPDLSRASILVIGAGEMGKVVASALNQKGVCRFTIVNRTLPRGQALAKRLSGTALDWSQLAHAVRQADIVISATGASQWVLTKEQIRPILESRKRCPLLLIDLAVPRDFDPGVGKIDGVKLYDLDHLKSVVGEGLQHRLQEVPKAESLVQEETRFFNQWLRERQIDPYIRKLRERAEHIRQQELQWALPKLEPLNQHQHQIVEMLSKRLANKLLHGHTQRFKKLAREVKHPESLLSQLLETQAEPDAEDSSDKQPRIQPLNQALNRLREEKQVKRVVVGTRGSALALVQTKLVVKQLKISYPQVTFDIEIIRTQGDAGNVEEKGAFVKELERALLNGQIDLAVHSLKDLPTDIIPELSLVTFPQRADVRDVLISREGLQLLQLPDGARVGTGSPRRSAQLQVLRQDLAILPIQGNVDTRLRTLQQGQFDAIILASAGLSRLGLLHHISEYFSPDVMLPAVGQGALVVETRADDRFVQELVNVLDHSESRAAVLAERALLHQLGGGCRVPIAAYGRVENGLLVLDGLVASPDGQHVLKDRQIGEPEDAVSIGKTLGKCLLEAGAAKLLRLEHV